MYSKVLYNIFLILSLYTYEKYYMTVVCIVGISRITDSLYTECIKIFGDGLYEALPYRCQLPARPEYCPMMPGLYQPARLAALWNTAVK